MTKKTITPHLNYRNQDDLEPSYRRYIKSKIIKKQEKKREIKTFFHFTYFQQEIVMDGTH